YLFLSPSGSSFNTTNGYVHYARDANADEWIDRYSFSPGDPEQLGTGNGGYGPNITGTVCRTAPQFGTDGVPRQSTDRFPRDGVYAYWDYNKGVATRYFDPVKPAGVAIDGQNDDVGNLDTPGGQSLYLDVPDPTFNVPAVILNWEEVSGAGNDGSLVYVNE